VTRFLRYLWAGPTTIIGLVMALALSRHGRLALVDGVIEAHSPQMDRALGWLTPLAGGADAMTLGHVVVGRNARALESTRVHERVHVRQCERWGPFFVPAYIIAGIWAAGRGGHPYYDNAFERSAIDQTTLTRRCPDPASHVPSSSSAASPEPGDSGLPEYRETPARVL
jgi:hypothetical protein